MCLRKSRIIELFDYLRNNPDTAGGEPSHTSGSVAQAMAAADVKVEQHYTVQYIAHAPLEPRAAVAEWNGDKLTVWTGTQRPFGVRDELAEAFRIPARESASSCPTWAVAMEASTQANVPSRQRASPKPPGSR